MKALVYSFYFPPHGGPGALRPLKLLKYSAIEGLEGVVVSSAVGDYDVIDDSIVGEIPQEFHVVRTAENLDPLRMIRKRRANAIHYPKSDFYFLPDNKIWWINSAMKLGIGSIEKSDFVFATCPPFSSAITANRTAKKLGVPLVLDFRDSWTRNPNRLELPAIHKKINEIIARRTVSSARLITCVYDSICDEMRELAPNARIEILPNGYDPSDFPQEKKESEKSAPLQIFYLGTIYSGLNYPLPFLEALARTENAFLSITGRCPDELKNDIARLNLEKRIELLGYLPRKEALAKLSESDVALLFIDSRRLNLGQITSKTYEYLGIGKPILACVPALGEAALLLKKYPKHFIVNPDDRDGIFRKIEEISELKKRGILPKNIPPVEFDRRNLAHSWLELVKNALK